MVYLFKWLIKTVVVVVVVVVYQTLTLTVSLVHSSVSPIVR